MKWILKSFSIETILEFVVAWLAATVKNPNSAKAGRLIRIVSDLQRLSKQFLDQVAVQQESIDG